MDETDLHALCLNPEDIARVAEFFGDDTDAAFEFARRVWLPDASRTAADIIDAIAARNWTALLFLCDHLREGARSVGACRIMNYASDIERAARIRSWYGLMRKAKDLKCALDTIDTLLVDCA